MSFYHPWTYGMTPMDAASIEHRRVHAIRNVARQAAEDAAMVAFAGREDQAQARLDADQIGQRAYHALKVEGAA